MHSSLIRVSGLIMVLLIVIGMKASIRPAPRKTKSIVINEKLNTSAEVNTSVRKYSDEDDTAVDVYNQETSFNTRGSEMMSTSLLEPITEKPSFLSSSKQDSPGLRRHSCQNYSLPNLDSRPDVGDDANVRKNSNDDQFMQNQLKYRIMTTAPNETVESITSLDQEELDKVDGPFSHRTESLDMVLSDKSPRNDPSPREMTKSVHLMNPSLNMLTAQRRLSKSLITSPKTSPKMEAQQLSNSNIDVMRLQGINMNLLLPSPKAQDNAPRKVSFMDSPNPNRQRAMTSVSVTQSPNAHMKEKGETVVVDARQRVRSTSTDLNRYMERIIPKFSGNMYRTKLWLVINILLVLSRYLLNLNGPSTLQELIDLI